MRERELKFDLRGPCSDCPFRTDGHDIHLSRGRAQEIATAITTEGRTFSCHKTVERGDDDEPTFQGEHCAGAAILLEKLNRPNQWMRWMERLGFYDKTKLKMDSPVFDTPDEFVQHHAGDMHGPQ